MKIQKDWAEHRFNEMEEQIRNTRTWVYRNKDEYEDRATDYVATRLMDRLVRKFFE
jgi:hypothetical protein